MPLAGRGNTEEQGWNGSQRADRRRREGWNMEGEEETDRHWEKDTGSQKEQREKKSKALWVFLYFQSSILFTSILVIELCPY